MLKGRLGLETARVPHVDRDGLIWLSRGRVYVEAGCLQLETAGGGELCPGTYSIPFQTVSMVILGPGSSITHDALRLLARHGTGLLAAGEDGVRLYASMPFGPDSSELARMQASAWSNSQRRTSIARRLYAWRLGEVLPDADLNVLRGIEGARAKKMYEVVANRFGIHWEGRLYDRKNPNATNDANLAINHAASAVEGAAMIAVASTGTIPQLGFIHEAAGHSFTLDIADLYRDSVTLPVAFGALKDMQVNGHLGIERLVRIRAKEIFVRGKIISGMIEKIKELFGGDDCCGN